MIWKYYVSKMAAVCSPARKAFADVEILEIRVGFIKIMFSAAAAASASYFFI